MKLYVYCLAEAVDGAAESLHGIAAARVRAFQSEGLSLLVSDFAGDVVAVNRENVLAHAAVIQTVFKKETPLPVRFGTLVTEAQLESYVLARRAALEAKLAVVRGCAEMNVKVVSAREWTEPPAVTVGEEKPGTAFLTEKRREILGGEARAEEAKRVAEWLSGQLGDLVQQTQLSKTPTDKMILAAAHLVRRDQVEQYRTMLAQARNEQPELHFLVSGPWAPYSFANVDLEFKTQFGVS